MNADNARRIDRETNAALDLAHDAYEGGTEWDKRLARCRLEGRLDLGCTNEQRERIMTMYRLLGAQLGAES